MRFASGMAVLSLVAALGCSGDTFAPAPGGSAGVGGGGGGGSGAAGASAGGGGGGAGNGQAGSGPGGEAGSLAGGAGGSEPAGAGGATAGAGSGGSAAAGSGGSAGSGGIGTTCPILFVKAGASNDAGRGCDPKKPLGGVGAAIAAAKASHADPEAKQRVGRILICNGTYVEAGALVLDVPVSLEGGFVCDGDQWILPANATAAGYASDPPTKIEFGAVQGLAITGASITRSVSISRLSLVPPPGVRPGVQSAIGVEVLDGAAPTLQQNKIASQGSVGTVFGSAGVVVRTNASPLIVASVIEPGRGTITAGPTAGLTVAGGSIGVYIGPQGGPTELRSNVIVGGQGAATVDAVATAGVFSHGKQLIIEDTLITGGTGATLFSGGPGESPIVSVGVVVAGQGLAKPTVLVTKSAISGGRTKGTTGSSSIGILAVQATLNIDRSRIYGGDSNELTAEPTSLPANSVGYGVLAQGGVVNVSNSVLHGGGADVEPTTRATRFTRGVAVDGARLEGRHATILAGVGSDNSIGVYFSNGGGASLSSSLVVAETPSSWSFFATKSACTQGKLASASSLTNVVFVQPEITATSTLFRGETGGSCLDTPSPNELVGRGFQTVGTKRVVENPAQIPADLLHVPNCKSNDACRQVLFPDFDSSSGAVLSGGALTPTCAAPPGFLKGGGVPAVELDLAGNKRPAADATPGAFQPPCK